MYIAPQSCGCPLTEGASILNSPICNGTILFMAIVENLLKGQCDISTPCANVQPVENVRDTYDFIVVGGGTAGSIVAARLSENRHNKVLILEAGGPDPIGDRVPSFYRTYWSNSEVDWSYRMVPDKNYCLDQGSKGCLTKRGKALGGSSVLNGMMYHRGHAADYDDWVQAGAEGWSWEENLPYFYMTEGNKEIGTVVKADYHSASGPMPIKRFNYQPPFMYELLKSINETGLPVIEDLNDPTTPEGFAITQAFNFGGQRYTTARAYLKQRPNLDVVLYAHVSKVLTKKVNGMIRAIGVQYYDKNGKIKTVHASKEVILSAGALSSPQILMLSGIGPKEVLHKFKIPIVKDLPSVGQNLRNPIGMTLYYTLTKVENTRTLDWTAVTEYLVNRGGPMSANGLSQLSGGLYSSLANRTRNQPDLQFFFNGYYAECSKTGLVGEKVGDCSEEGLNITMNAVSLLPKSVGYMTLQSTDPFDPLLFYSNYFSHPDDMVMLKDGARYVNQILNTTYLKTNYGIKLDPAYSKACSKNTVWSDKWIECMARIYTYPQSHHMGSTAIGLVVDTQLRVYDIPNLRVIDAGVMPRSLSGNPQAAVMMVAERGSSFIRQDWE